MSKLTTELRRSYSSNGLSRNESFTELKPNVDIASVETMLSRNKLEYDFDTTLVKGISVTKGSSKEGSRQLVIREAVLNYNKLFEDLCSNPESVGLKLNFTVIRLKPNTLLVEGLLRDFIKRCNLHMRMLSKTKDLVYYVKQSRLFLKEIGQFNSKEERVFKYMDEAILYYRSSSDGEFHLLEREIYSLREKAEFKGLRNKLKRSVALLESELNVSGSKAEIENTLSAPRVLWFPVILPSRPLDFSYPWYDSDWVILVCCGVIVLGAAYFLTRNDDDGDGGGPGLNSSSGIMSSKGLLELLPSQDAFPPQAVRLTAGLARFSPFHTNTNSLFSSSSTNCLSLLPPDPFFHHHFCSSSGEGSNSDLSDAAYSGASFGERWSDHTDDIQKVASSLEKEGLIRDEHLKELKSVGSALVHTEIPDLNEVVNEAARERIEKNGTDKVAAQVQNVLSNLDVARNAAHFLQNEVEEHLDKQAKKRMLPGEGEARASQLSQILNIQIIPAIKDVIFAYRDLRQAAASLDSDSADNSMNSDADSGGGDGEE